MSKLIGFDKPALEIPGLRKVTEEEAATDKLHEDIQALLAGQDATVAMNALCMSMAVTLILATDAPAEAVKQAGIIPAVVSQNITKNWNVVRIAATKGSTEAGQA